MSKGERANRKGVWCPLCASEMKVEPCKGALNPEMQSQAVIILAESSQLKN